MSASSTDILIFRITGPQSIERLEPLVPHVFPKNKSFCSGPGSKVSGEIIDGDNFSTRVPPSDLPHFVWETTCEQTWREWHCKAIVLNKLHNSTILEDKANFAFLQLRIQEHYKHVLPTFIALGADDALRWAQAHWPSVTVPFDEKGSATSKDKDSDWWVIKAAAGNGGKDVWIISRETYLDVITQKMPYDKEGAVAEDLVIQKFASRPLLFKGKKFHFRCYSMLRGDMSAMLYRMAYILTAGYTYNKTADGTAPGDQVGDMDPRKLITNLSVNKHIEGYPGQLPCDLTIHYPDLYARICQLWKAVAIAVTPFMRKQRSKHHFEFYGIDIIADEDGHCWLLEINRLPGLESSKLNKVEEDRMYDTMMESLLHIVLLPLRKSDDACNYGLWEVVHGPTAQDMQMCSQGRAFIHQNAAAHVATDAGSDILFNGETWSNIFSWRAFTKRKENRKAIVFDTAAQDQKSAPMTAVSATSSATSTTRRCCAAPGCALAAPMKCSRCKQASYCGAAHQKEHWPVHKSTCKPPSTAPSASAPPSKPTSQSAAASPPVPPTAASYPGRETRFSRCMFCGEEVHMECEEDAYDHMQTCSALQEQLNSKDQFTIPKVLRDKGITLADVHKSAP